MLAGLLVVKHLSEQERRTFNLMILGSMNQILRRKNDRIKHDTDIFNEIMDTYLGLGTNNNIGVYMR